MRNSCSTLVQILCINYVFLNTYMFSGSNINLIVGVYTCIFVFLFPPEWMGIFVSADETYRSTSHFSTELNKLSLIVFVV